MAMARDGLLPPFFSDISKFSQVPVKSTVATGLGAAILAFFMDVSQLAGMVSVGTLLAFTTVAISILILRYIPPDVIPLPPSLEESNDSDSSKNRWIRDHRYGKQGEANIDASEDIKPAVIKEDMPIDCPLISQHFAMGNYIDESNRRKIVGWVIALTCLGVLILTYAASDSSLFRPVRFTFCGVGGILVLGGLISLTCIDQDDARHNFGYSGGFICPLVPLLPIACILINCYLLINLGAATWARVSIWLAIGVLVYVFYGRTHSSLRDALYVPVSHTDKMHLASTSCLA